MRAKTKHTIATRRAANHGQLGQWIGRAILELRSKKGLKIADFASQCGVDRTAVIWWETGVCCPAVNKLPAVAKALGLKTAGELVSYAQEQYEGAEPTEEAAQ